MSATPHAWRTGHSAEAIQAAVARNAQKARAEAAAFVEWRKPTGDTQPAIRVGRGELTCLNCGEPFGGSTPVTGESMSCWRCGGKAGVPTTSYLREGEYWVI